MSNLISRTTFLSFVSHTVQAVSITSQGRICNLGKVSSRVECVARIARKLARNSFSNFSNFLENFRVKKFRVKKYATIIKESVRYKCDKSESELLAR